MELFDPTSLLLGGGMVLLCLLWWLSTRRPSGLPPGPGPALPLLGHLHLVPKDPRAQFWTWRRQYGDVFCLYMGGKLVVVLASYSAIREALVTLANAFSDRPHVLFMEKMVKNKGGVVGTSGPLWKEQRKISLDILREMGMGKNELAGKIQEEITYYIKAIKDHQGAPVDLVQMTKVSVSNNICSIMFGQRFQYGDGEFNSYIECFDRNFKHLSGTAILNFLPVLGYIPGDPFKMQEVVTNTGNVCAFVDKQVANHKKTLKKEEKVASTDYIYSYLREAEKRKSYGNTDTTVNEANLQQSVFDMFLGGTETTSTTLQWAMIFFVNYPHVQDKCFKEISEVIGTDRTPTMHDRPNLKYLEATSMEIMRKGDIGPLGLWHASAHDVTFRDYVIPKGAIVMPILTCVLQDPEIWGDPENFRPERFIGPDGKLTRPEEFIPFGIGRRVCLGESLARMELFLYLVNLVQNFRFLPAEEGQLPSLDGVLGLAYVPKPFKIRAVPRI